MKSKRIFPASPPHGTSPDTYAKKPIAQSTQTPGHEPPLQPDNQEKETSSSVRQGHAAFLANSTMQRKINEAFKKTFVTQPTQAGKNDKNIANALYTAAKENNVQVIHDFAINQLNNIPPNERLAWLRKLGADKAMYKTMASGSAEAIEAWGRVVALLPEGSGFAFLNERIRDRNTEYKAVNGNFFTALAFRRIRQIAPKEVRITSRGWGFVDNVTGTRVPIPKIVETVGVGITQDLAHNFTQRLLGKPSKFLFPDKRSNGNNAAARRELRPVWELDFKASYESDKNGYHNSIATGIFSNTQPGTMEAWGKLLKLIPDQDQERSKLLFARMDSEAGTPALALLFERRERQALDQFVELAKQHVWHGNEDIHHVLWDCMPALKILTSTRGNMYGKEAQDWVTADGLKYTNPHGLSLNSEHIAKAYGELVQLTPKKYRNDLFFPEDIWTTFDVRKDRRSALTDQLHPQQARELAHSITLLKAMVPTMTAEERKTVLNEIRFRHATKVIGIWKNTASYEKFKKAWPALDAMLLDLKAELKKE